MANWTSRFAVGGVALAFGLTTSVNADEQPSGDNPEQAAGQVGEEGAAGQDAEDRLLRAERLDQRSDDTSSGGSDPAPREAAGRMPTGFDRLGLTQREQAEVLRVAAQYDRQIEDLLQQFAQMHAEAIGAEGIVLAESMRKNDGAIASAEVTEEADAHARSGQPASGQRTAGFRPGDAAGADGSAEKIKELGQASPLAGPAGETWQKLHELHLRAVKVEAQKLAAIEKLLSPEQIERLHGFRKESSGHGGEGTADRPDRPDLQNANQNAEEERRDREADRARGTGGAEAGGVEPNRADEPRGPGED